jgi:hypothetical protein
MLLKKGSVVYRKRDPKNGKAYLTTVRLSPLANEALKGIKAQFSAAYPPEKFPSLGILFEQALVRFAEDIKFDGRELSAALSEMQAQGYPIRRSQA